MRPPNASPTTTSAEAVRLAAQRHARVADADPQAGPGPQPELVAREVDQLAVDLEHARARARPRRGDVARQREPAAADEDARRAARRPGAARRARRPSSARRRTRGGAGRRGRRRSGAGRRAAARGPTAGPRRPRPARSSRRSRSCSACRRRPPPRPAAPRVPAATAGAPPGNARKRDGRPRMPASTSSAAERRPRVTRTGSSGTSTKPVANVPTSAPAVAHAESRPTTVPLAREVAELELHHDGRDRAEHGRRRQQREQRDRERAGVAAAVERLAEHAHERHRRHREQPARDQQHGQQPPPVEPVGRAPAERGAGRDAGEHDADDRRVGLERQPDVGREQPDAEDLEHEHRARRAGRRAPPRAPAGARRAAARSAPQPRDRVDHEVPEARRRRASTATRAFGARPSRPSRSTTVAPRVQRPSVSIATNAGTQRTTSGSATSATAHGSWTGGAAKPNSVAVRRRRRTSSHADDPVGQRGAERADPLDHRGRRQRLVGQVEADHRERDAAARAPPRRPRGRPTR